MDQRFAFDDVAELYDAARPAYPAALVDDVITAADLMAEDAVLEVGCGTGQATEAFARRGYDIVAVEPGAELARVARRRLADWPNAAVVESRFEDWRMEFGVFRAVIAAQSWHWVAPEIRFAKAAQALTPGGVLAVFGHVPMAPPPRIAQAFAPIFARLAPELWTEPPENWYLPSGPLPEFFTESGLFWPVSHKRYGWSVTRTGASLADYLRTTSPYQRLAPARREALLGALAEAVDAEGGRFDHRWETHLHMARRSG
jgi:cyclopropane fatty-acyl-phospholipid synthase-like methyltransferase